VSNKNLFQNFQKFQKNCQNLSKSLAKFPFRRLAKKYPLFNFYQFWKNRLIFVIFKFPFPSDGKTSLPVSTSFSLSFLQLHFFITNCVDSLWLEFNFPSIEVDNNKNIRQWELLLRRNSIEQWSRDWKMPSEKWSNQRVSWLFYQNFK
jgi:hypothetical protein